MTTTQFILIFLAIAAIVWGLMTVIKSVRKNKAVAHLPPSDTATAIESTESAKLDTEKTATKVDTSSDTLNLSSQITDSAKDGIPIIPRHERPQPATAAKEITTDEVAATVSEPVISSFEQNRQRSIQADSVEPQALSATDTVYSIDKNHAPISTVSSTTIISPSLMTTSDEPDAFSALANATETLTPVVQTYDESQLKTDVFSENSPILDTHIQAQIDQEQNSPLNNAEQNINISLFPNNQFDRIQGRDLLSLVDKYGLKYGAMNMFHRYENKDGTGLLWFSMMQVDDEGVSPFDLNKLPMQSLKGLVLFLSLPHPKAVQGFDSMISIAGLLAQDLESSLYDHDGEPINRDSIQYMRELAMDYGKNV